jgi:hypothetical protein
MFLEEIALNDKNIDNSKFFMEMANKWYNSEQFLQDDIKTIKELLK